LSSFRHVFSTASPKTRSAPACTSSYGKAIVFCHDIDHASRMRTALVNEIATKLPEASPPIAATFKETAILDDDGVTAWGHNPLGELPDVVFEAVEKVFARTGEILKAGAPTAATAGVAPMLFGCRSHSDGNGRGRQRGDCSGMMARSFRILPHVGGRPMPDYHNHERREAADLSDLTSMEALQAFLGRTRSPEDSFEDFERELGQHMRRVECELKATDFTAPPSHGLLLSVIRSLRARDQRGVAGGTAAAGS
jgi:hypothetical protein